MIRDVANKLFEIEWATHDSGYLQCPGEHHHTKPTGNRDCKIFLSNVPTIFCFHQGCQSDVADANHQLRSACWRAEHGNGEKLRCRRRTKEELQAERDRHERLRRHMALEHQARRTAPVIQRQYRWSMQEAIASSPTPVPEDTAEHWRLLLSLFRPDDVVWIGDEYDTGDKSQERHFRTAHQWLTCRGRPPYHFTCPSTFQPGSWSRCNANVVDHRYLVAESDTLTRDAVCAVFKWCVASDMRLRAIVDTAGKSLHAWFEMPCAEHLAELKIILPELEIDPACFRPSQPVRIPSALRDDRQQRLIWFDPPQQNKE